MALAMVIEYAFLPESGKDTIKLSDFRLWPGHRASVLAEDNIYIPCFARGGGGAVKYRFEGRESLKPFLLYKPCHNSFQRLEPCFTRNVQLWLCAKKS